MFASAPSSFFPPWKCLAPLGELTAAKENKAFLLERVVQTRLLSGNAAWFLQLAVPGHSQRKRFEFYIPAREWLKFSLLLLSSLSLRRDSPGVGVPLWSWSISTIFRWVSILKIKAI